MISELIRIEQSEYKQLNFENRLIIEINTNFNFKLLSI